MRYLAVLGLVGALLTASTTPAASQVMIGAHVGTAGDPNWQSELLKLESQLGRKLAIDSDYDDWAAFPDTPRIKWDIQTGHLPMQSWRILFQVTNPNACATAAAINKGTYDVQLTQQARAAKALGSTIFVRFNYEMTGNQENTCFTGFPIANNLPLAGQEFIQAWRHVVNIFRAAGANNVKWVWAPTVGGFEGGVWKLFYPGSTYVDWIGVDTYNTNNTVLPFGNNPGIPQFYAAGVTLGKPLMVSENAAFADPSQTPDPMTVWVRTADTYMKAHPQVQAYIWWNSNAQNPPPPPYAGTDYLLSGAGLRAFAAMAHDPYFGGQ